MIAGMGAISVSYEGGCSGAENMRRDLHLLQSSAAGEVSCAVRVYWFTPACLSLGRLQPESDVDVDACARDGVDVVRRPSGGRAVLHDDEVTYALACRVDDPNFGGDVMTSCARIHAAVADALADLGVITMPHAPAPVERRAGRAVAAPADCFAQPAAHELLDPRGGKLVGSAQARRGRALLQHGSVLLSPSRAAMYVRPPSPVRRPPSPGLRGLLGRDVERDQVARALVTSFEQILCAKPLDTTA